jgi:hypothetical protein
VKVNTLYGRKQTFSGFEISQSVPGHHGNNILEKKVKRWEVDYFMSKVKGKAIPVPGGGGP